MANTESKNENASNVWKEFLQKWVKPVPIGTTAAIIILGISAILIFNYVKGNNPPEPHKLYGPPIANPISLGESNIITNNEVPSEEINLIVASKPDSTNATVMTEPIASTSSEETAPEETTQPFLTWEANPTIEIELANDPSIETITEIPLTITPSTSSEPILATDIEITSKIEPILASSTTTEPESEIESKPSIETEVNPTETKPVIETEVEPITEVETKPVTKVETKPPKIKPTTTPIKPRTIEVAEANTSKEEKYKGLETPTTPEDYLHKGMRESNQGKHEKAALSFANAIRMNNYYEPAYIELGKAYTRLNELDKALSVYERLLVINPNNVESYNRIGAIYHTENNLEKAEQSYKKAIQLNPKNTSAYFGLAAVYRAQGRLKEADKQYNLGISLIQ